MKKKEIMHVLSRYILLLVMFAVLIGFIFIIRPTSSEETPEHKLIKEIVSRSKECPRVGLFIGYNDDEIFIGTPDSTVTNMTDFTQVMDVRCLQQNG